MPRRNRYKPYPVTPANLSSIGASQSNVTSGVQVASTTPQRRSLRTGGVPPTVAPAPTVPTIPPTVAPAPTVPTIPPTVAPAPTVPTMLSAAASGKRPTHELEVESPNTSQEAERLIASADLDLFNGPAGESDHHRKGPEANDPRHSTSSSNDETPDSPGTSPSAASGSRKPDIYTPLGGFPLLNFNRMARDADLDEESKAMGRRLCTAKGGEDQFMACIVASLADRQEVRELRDEVTQRLSALESGRALPRSDSFVWKASKELRGVIRMVACQSVLGGDVQAYTATEDRLDDQDRLPLCFFAKVMSAVLANPSEWKNRLLPSGYGSDPDPASTQALRTLINTILKEVRKEFKDIFLSNINLQKSGNSTTSNANVPIIDTIIVKLYQKERDLVGGRVRVREEILKEVDNLCTARYAWLRMQAIHWGLNRGIYNNRSFWDVVDEKLEFLRSQSRRYRYAFYLLVLQDDYDRIDGKKNFTQLKEINDFALPTENRIQDTIQQLNQTFGTDLAPDEAMHDQVETEAD
ncbi:hypothetical protein DFH28DRAFT_1166782 [Melampsora americana]|nr:hypothetical protein DFH28DRAFT_1166782 [Melampsora americana]